LREKKQNLGGKSFRGKMDLLYFKQWKWIQRRHALQADVFFGRG
jgi:hypothetical protein